MFLSVLHPVVFLCVLHPTVRVVCVLCVHVLASCHVSSKRALAWHADSQT